MSNDSLAVAVRLSESSRTQLDLLTERWGVQMSEAIRRAIWLCWRAETCGDPLTQPNPPPGAASQ